MNYAFKPAACAALLVLSLSACFRSPAEKSARYIEAGKQMLQKKDIGRALLQFRNAVTASPGNAEAHYQLGRASFAGGDYSSAVAAFRRTLAIDPKHAGARLQMAQMMADTSNEALLKEAQGDLQQLLSEGAASPETLNTLALAELKLGNPESAAQALQRALSEFSPDLGSFTMLAQAKLQQNDKAGAEETLKKACRDLPHSANARRVLAEFYAYFGRAADAESELRAAIAIDPKDGPALSDLARLRVVQGNSQEADQLFRRLSAIDGYRASYGAFLYQAGRRDEAVREFEKLARERRDDRQIRTYLLSAYRLAGRSADVDRYLADAIKRNNKDTDALLKRAELLLERGRLDIAEADLNAVIKLTPTSVEGHYLHALISKQRGQSQQYRQELAETLRLNPALLKVRIDVAQDLANAGDTKGALDVLDAALPSQRSATTLLAARNWIYWAKGDLAAMRKGLDAGLARERTLEFLIQDGLWHSRSGNSARAQASFREALNIDPANLAALQALTNTYNQKNLPAAIEQVKQYASRAPGSPAVQTFLGQLLLAKGDRAEARKVFDAAKAADPKAAEPDYALIQLDYTEGRLDAARTRLQNIVSAQPAAPTPRLWLGVIELETGNHDAAIAHFRAVLASKPDHALAANNLAYALAEHNGSFDEALKYAQKAVELSPDDPAYADTLGWIFFRKALYSSAIRYLEQATKDPSNTVAKYHLAMAYAKAGDPRGPLILREALKVDSALPEARAAQDLLGVRR
jgi:tetratricopeptide (TPR) repeat protein